MEGVIPGKLKQQLWLCDILALGAFNQVADQLNLISSSKRLQHLGGQVTVAIIDLMKVFDYVRIPGFNPLPLALLTPFL